MLFEHALKNFEAQKISIVCVLSGAVTINRHENGYFCLNYIIKKS